MQKIPLQMTKYPSSNPFIAEDDTRFIRWQRLILRLLVATLVVFIVWLICFVCSYRLIIVHR